MTPSSLCQDFVVAPQHSRSSPVAHSHAAGVWLKKATTGFGVDAMAIRTVRLAATLAVLVAPLCACQQFLPRDDTPTILTPLANAPANGPSSQRRDANGYPLIGAYPTAAMPQASNDDVQQTRERFATIAARRAGGADTGAYQRNVSELQTIADQQQSEAEARLRASTDAGAAAASSRAQ